MGFTVTNLEGLVKIRKHLERAAKLDYTPLMEEGARILQQDNIRRSLAGLDCNDQSMPSTQRERDPKQTQLGAKGTGKPLDPNREQSRIVANVRVSWTQNHAAPWYSTLAWMGFDSKRGEPILAFHAHTRGHDWPYPKRDVISHPTPTATKKFRAALRAFVRSELRKKP